MHEDFREEKERQKGNAMKLSEELKHCLDGDGCGRCKYGEVETKLTCRGLLQAAYEEIKKNEEREGKGNGEVDKGK